MTSAKVPISEGARKAYRAQRLERVSLAIAGLFTICGLAMVFLAIFTPEPRDMWSPLRLTAQEFFRGYAFSNQLLYLGALSLGLGILAFRTTAAYEIARKGPRFPRRIRLPFDSTVEIGVSANQVQQRTGMIVGDRRGPEPPQQ